MYISPRKKKTYIIIGAVLVGSIVIGVLGYKYFTDWRTGAFSSPTPEDVRISDLTETSVTLSWITPDKSAEGWVKYSTSSTLGADAQVAQDYRDVYDGQTTARTTHYVTVSSLNPGVQYYFSIGSGGKEYKDTSGDAFDFTTAESGSYSSPPSPDPVYGTVTNGSDQSTIVYVTLGSGSNKSFPVSTITNDSGNFEVDLSHVRNAALTGAYSYEDSTVMSVMAQGGDKGGAIVETTAGIGSSLSLTMDESFSTTTFFAESSAVDTGGSSSDTTTTTDTTTDTTDEITLTSMDIPDIITDSTGIDNVYTSNVTENSFSVIWESDEKEQGYLIYGTSASALTSEAIDDRDSLTSKSTYYMHHITVKDIEPETTYYYKIVSGSVQYMGTSGAYSITTPATESSPPSSQTVAGTVTGTAQADAVILIKLTKSGVDSSYASVSSDAEGDWLVDIGSLRSADYSSYFEPDDTDTILVKGVSAGDTDSSTYTLSETEGQVLGVSLNIEKGTSLISELPETAIHGIAAVGITFAIVMIVYGGMLLGNYYHDERKTRWEKDFLQDIGEK